MGDPLKETKTNQATKPKGTEIMSEARINEYKDQRDV